MEFKRPLLRLYFKGLFSSVVLEDLQKRCIDMCSKCRQKGDLLVLGLTEILKAIMNRFQQKEF